MEVKVAGEYKGCVVLHGVLSTEHESSNDGVPVLVRDPDDGGYRPGECVEVEFERWISLDDIVLVPDPAEDPQEARRMLDAWYKQRPLVE